MKETIIILSSVLIVILISAFYTVDNLILRKNSYELIVTQKRTIINPLLEYKKYIQEDYSFVRDFSDENISYICIIKKGPELFVVNCDEKIFDSIKVNTKNRVNITKTWISGEYIDIKVFPIYTNVN